jgi:hypothetical protein
MFFPSSDILIMDVVSRSMCNLFIKEVIMPLFLDIHQHVPGLTKEALEDAHAKDLEVQSKYNAHYLRYWYDIENGKVFCLVEAPDKESANSVHREAHGLVADEIVEVMEGVVENQPHEEVAG